MPSIEVLDTPNLRFPGASRNRDVYGGPSRSAGYQETTLLSGKSASVATFF